MKSLDHRISIKANEGKAVITYITAILTQEWRYEKYNIIHTLANNQAVALAGIESLNRLVIVQIDFHDELVISVSCKDAQLQDLILERVVELARNPLPVVV